MKSTLDQLREWGKQAAKQAAELKRLHDYDTRLTAVMPADFKDWHENSRNEWPEIAAGVITSLRERENEAWKEVERLSALADNAELCGGTSATNAVLNGKT